MKRLIFVTGKPRTGKTTTLLEVANRLAARDYRVGGMISQEIRERGIRVGFEVYDYASGRKGWLAHVRQPGGPRIGKYRVNVVDLDSIGVKAILNALGNADVVLIDEIGPMELSSEAFRQAVREVARSSKPVVGTIHYRSRNHLVEQLKSRKDACVVEVTQELGAKLSISIVNKVIKFKQRETV